MIDPEHLRDAYAGVQPDPWAVARLRTRLEQPRYEPDWVELAWRLFARRLALPLLVAAATAGVWNHLVTDPAAQTDSLWTEYVSGSADGSLNLPEIWTLP